MHLNLWNDSQVVALVGAADDTTQRAPVSIFKRLPAHTQHAVSPSVSLALGQIAAADGLAVAAVLELG